MKKSLLALGVLAAFAGVASAQSSVTIWGIVDQSANNIKNGTVTTRTLQSNMLSSNRLGFRGIEDMGGGLKAGFWLEAGMNNENGNVGGSNGQTAPAAGTTLFNRRSTVSLYSALGEIRLGRDYVPSFWNTVYGDVNGANGMGEGLNLIDTTLGSKAITFVRTNQSIGYFLPAGLGGVYGQAMVSSSGNVVGEKYAGGRIGFAAGPVDVAVAYSETKGTATPDSFKVFNIGGSYDFGVVKLFGFYNENKYGAAKQDVYELSAGIPIGPGQLRGSYGHASGKGNNPLTAPVNDGKTAKLYSIEYVYDLSKRTSLYTTYGEIKNSGGAAFVVGSSAGNTNALNAKSQGYNFGLRHAF